MANLIYVLSSASTSTTAILHVKNVVSDKGGRWFVHEINHIMHSFTNPFDLLPNSIFTHSGRRTNALRSVTIMAGSWAKIQHCCLPKQKPAFQTVELQVQDCRIALSCKTARFHHLTSCTSNPLQHNLYRDGVIWSGLSLIIFNVMEEFKKGRKLKSKWGFNVVKRDSPSSRTAPCSSH